MAKKTASKATPDRVRLGEIQDAAACADTAKAKWEKRKEAAKDAKETYDVACNDLLDLCRPIDEPLLEQD